MDKTAREMLAAPSDPFSYSDDDAKWHAVQVRDTCADGLFVYAVRTTNVYCRPICKARLARRANVRFYPTAAAAQAAGFRACKRCKPDLAGFMPEERAVRQIRALVASRGDGAAGAVSLSQMAARSGLSKWHFHRVFKKCVGLTPGDYLRAQRRGGGPAWMQQQLDLEGGDVDLLGRPLDDVPVATDGAGPGEAFPMPEGSGSASLSEHGAFSLDDLLAWPEDRNDG